tara:strand:- start:985 stop:2046 length:1062 start_codon:yes stop_codon:yes gene_type:complete
MANLLHTKGTRTQIYKTLPSNSVGNDGDIILSQIQGKGVYLCSKVNGRWHVSNKMEELHKIEKTSIKDLKLDRVRIGNTTITKDEYDVSSGDLTLDVAGDIELNADSGQVNIKDGTANHFLFDCDSTRFRIFDDDNISDHFTISVGAEGATTLTTVDADTAVAHLTLDPDGDVLISGADTKTDATKKIYFDGGTHTYIHESADDVLQIIVGGDTLLILDEANNLNTFNTGLTYCPRGFIVDTNRRMTFDGTSGHTYINESTDDLLNFTVGAAELLAIAEDATTSVAQSSKIFTACPIYLKDIGGTSDTPASGFGSLYVNSDVLYFKTDGGTETNLLAGGGGGLNSIVAAMVFG